MSVHAIYKALKQLCSKGSKNQISNIKKNEKEIKKNKKRQKSIDEQIIIIKAG